MPARITIRLLLPVALIALLALGFRLRQSVNPPVSAPVSTRGNQVAVPPEQVLVVMNASSPDSREIANYYSEKRKIPLANILRISCPVTYNWTKTEYQNLLETPVLRRIAADPGIHYIVLTKDIPLRFSGFGFEGGYSTDSVLATCLMPTRPVGKIRNPYFGKNERHARTTHNLLLVSRLDGPSLALVKGMIDSSLAAKPVNGPFFLRDSFVLDMAMARDVLVAKGFLVEWVKGFNNAEKPLYQGSGGPFMAHYGAGPHDTQYSKEEYAAIRFLPGALGEITWSTSAADLRNPKNSGNIATMIAGGAAGAHGFVSEPYADAVSRPETVLDRYTSGFNLAESFYMGMPYLHWKNVVLGDPLCAPYAKK